jgi:hemolysin III
MTGSPALLRPRMRGWLHLISFVVSVSAGTALIAMATTISGRAVVAMSIYTATILGLFGVSALYHRRTWQTEWGYTLMKRLDHSMIFLFIAGTYTPFTLLAMPPSTGWVIFGIVWSGAVLGVGLKLLWPRSPRWLGVPIYLGLGWVAVFVFPELLSRVGVAAFVLLLAGGLAYTVGGILYAARWPNPWPSTFGYHEFFHACTVVAAICHYIAIWFALYS